MSQIDREKELLNLIQSLRDQLATVSPHVLAHNTGATFDAGHSEFEIAVFSRGFVVPYPSFVARESAVEHHEGAVWIQALLMHYFRTADGTPLQHRWISLRELPGGMLYEQAFQGYSGDKLAKGFGDDIDRFSDTCRRLRADRAPIGDASFLFWALPRVPLLLAYWQGDDDFPSTARVLFDESASHYLPTDACAVLGGRLCNTVLHAAGQLDDSEFDQD